MDGDLRCLRSSAFSVPLGWVSHYGSVLGMPRTAPWILGFDPAAVAVLSVDFVDVAAGLSFVALVAAFVAAGAGAGAGVGDAGFVVNAALRAVEAVWSAA